MWKRVSWPLHDLTCISYCRWEGSTVSHGVQRIGAYGLLIWFRGILSLRMFYTEIYAENCLRKAVGGVGSSCLGSLAPLPTGQPLFPLISLATECDVFEALICWCLFAGAWWTRTSTAVSSASVPRLNVNHSTASPGQFLFSTNFLDVQ